MLITDRPVHIGHELVTNRTAVRVKTLTVNIIVMAVAILVIRLPGNDKATVRQRGDRRIALGLIGRGVNPELFAEWCATWRKDLTADIRAAATIVTAVILPGHHIVAVGKTRYRRIMLGGRLPGIDPNLFRLARQRQFAVTEANRLDTIQRIRAVVAIRRIDIGDRAGICIETVIRHLPRELGNVTAVAALKRIVPGAADQNVITTATLQRVVTAGTVEDIGPAAAFNHVRRVVTRTRDRIRTAEIQLFDIVTQGVALTRADHTVRTFTRQLRHHIVGTVNGIGVVAVATNERIRTITTGYPVITAARRNNSTGLTLDRQRVVAFTKVDRLYILDTKLIIAGTKRQAVRTLTKINRTLIHRLTKGHRLIGNAAGKADRRQR